MVVLFLLAVVIFLPRPCSSSIQRFEIAPGFEGPQMNFIDHDGLFLLSKDSVFAFGFVINSAQDTTHFVLAVVHQATRAVVWTANRGRPVSQSDNFVFGRDGNAYLQSGGATAVWSTNSSNKGVAVMRLLSTGNLVMLGGGNSSSDPIWQSFSHPTDTLLANQSFAEGMRLVSDPNGNNLSHILEIQGGDMMLFAGFRPPQPYWSLQQEKRKISNKFGGPIHSAVLESNSWNFYDQKQSLLWQFVVPANSSDPGVIWTAVLGGDGFISFSGLQSGGSTVSSSTRVPQGTCDAPVACGPYYVCEDRQCFCPAVLNSYPGCDPGVSASSCSSAGDGFQLEEVDGGIGYFATHFISPSANTNVSVCQAACLANCSCAALFYEEDSRSCYLFDQVGSLQRLSSNSTVSFIKVPRSRGNGQSPGQDGGGGGKHLTVVLAICLATAVVIAALIYVAVRVRRRQKRLPAEPSQMGSSEDDNFLDAISGMPVRFTYRELQDATDDFRVKLGQGGFGSVYLGKLPNGARIAVKKLEGIGQGKKEFRAEVSTIGSIHHVHLVRLRGFCAEGAHRLLAYEYLANGSLDRWIFRRGNDNERVQLSWDQRYHIALGTAKGLAYLHEDCESKIVHCDIKPENVLLDDNFVAKVSDFGLAKLMTREQSHVFTTMRGTRGYLAPEWITSYAISEKSDVYSYGMVLLELIGGRKNFDPSETSEKAHFPAYAFKKMEEGKLMEILDGELTSDDKDGSVEATLKVALWCIQEDLSLRPSMGKVVQMLEGLCYVPQPPTSSQIGFRMYANLFKSISEEGSSSVPSDCNSDTFLLAVRLSGPR